MSGSNHNYCISDIHYNAVAGITVRDMVNGKGQGKQLGGILGWTSATNKS